MSEDSTIVEVLLALLKRDSRYIQFVQEIVFKDLIGNSEIDLGNILNSEEEKREILLNICAFNCYFLLSLESIEHYYIKDEKFLLDILLKSKSSKHFFNISLFFNIIVQFKPHCITSKAKYSK